MQFEEPGLSFGLLQLGRQVSQQVTLRNTSQYSSAAWTLSEVPSTAQHTQHSTAAVTGLPFTPPGSLENTAGVGYPTPGAQQDNQATAVGLPAVLQQQAQQLLQQLQDSQDGVQEAAARASSRPHTPAGSDSMASQQQPGPDTETDHRNASEDTTGEAAVQDTSLEAADGVADEESPDRLSSAAGGGSDADKGGQNNPFEGPGVAEEEESSVAGMRVEPEWGVLAPGASVTIQVIRQTHLVL